MDSTLHRRNPAQPPAPLAASLPVGTVIAGRFTVEELAGRGGMGIVYRATDSLSGQPVALKLLRPFSNPDAPRRFTREAELLSSLRHPGIVAHVAHGQHEQEHPFLAMEWLEGETLAQRLADEPLRLEETLALLRHAAQALAFAHQHGVIHRDLKPSNLFLRQGRPQDVVLLDFGLARHTEPSTVVTASQVMLGTPGYMAPEQVSGQSPAMPSTDIFSLGCVLYECLTGQPPFSAPHLVATLAKILFTEPTPLRELRPELPVALQVLVERMLAREPSRRHPDAARLPGDGGAARPRLPALPRPLRRLPAARRAPGLRRVPSPARQAHAVRGPRARAGRAGDRLRGLWGGAERAGGAGDGPGGHRQVPASPRVPPPPGAPRARPAGAARPGRPDERGLGGWTARPGPAPVVRPLRRRAPRGAPGPALPARVPTPAPGGPGGGRRAGRAVRHSLLRRAQPEAACRARRSAVDAHPRGAGPGDLPRGRERPPPGGARPGGSALGRCAQHQAVGRGPARARGEVLHGAGPGAAPGGAVAARHVEAAHAGGAAARAEPQGG